MKTYYREWIVLIAQLLMFYGFPLFAGPTDAMGMVFLIIIATFALSLILGVSSGQKWKFLWPVCTAVCFVPTIYLHYNETAWIHAVWYLVISAVGLFLGSVLRKLFIKE